MYIFFKTGPLLTTVRFGTGKVLTCINISFITVYTMGDFLFFLFRRSASSERSMVQNNNKSLTDIENIF